MIDTLYIEEGVLEHPRVRRIAERFSRARKIVCRRYGEVFNPKAQNFRLQKRRPALILAEKFDRFVLPAPSGYGIGAGRNFYFSHMLNCLYDCRYCFLQGMYRSAHYVLFVNYEDFQAEIGRLATESAEVTHFFSGYDCDSLAFEPVTGFAEAFLPLFERLPQALLELRTKSTQIRTLLERPPLHNCVIAYSFTPDEIARAVEHKAPSVERRVAALQKLQQHGWPVGLRFDPLIFQTGYRSQYRRLLDEIFAAIDVSTLHSVSLGVFRLPEKFFKTIQRLYPEEKLLASPLQSHRGMVSYQSRLEREMVDFCSELVLEYIPAEKFFPCAA